MEYVQPIRDLDTLEEFKTTLKERNERDYVMFMLGITTGLRISDILALRVKDVRGDYIRNREIKTDKKRRTPISLELRKALNPYIQSMDEEDFLIKSRQRDEKGRQKAIHRSQAYRIIKEAAKAIGYKEDVGTHTGRKTFGYWHYKKYGNAAALRKIFNHDDDQTTLAYIGVDQDYLDETIMGLYRRR